MALDIGSANATAVLTVDDLFPSGITLDTFGSDQSITQDTITIAETRMSLDGKLLAGVVPSIYPVTITLEAPAQATKSLTTLWNACLTTFGIYNCSLVFTVPSIKRVFTWSNGVLVSGTPSPAAKKTLDPTTWLFHFESFEISDFGVGGIV